MQEIRTRGFIGFFRRVLIGEDFKDLRKLVAFYLGAHGYQVLEAANGKAAIKTATSGKRHLILLDFRLPYMNGPDVVRELRRLSQPKHRTYYRMER